MRVLILSDPIDQAQKYGKSKYVQPYDVQVDFGDPNDEHMSLSIFDYDVSIVHIIEPAYHSIGYFHTLPKILHDAAIALQHGRTVICFPACNDFRSTRLNQDGMRVYEWIGQLGLALQDDTGVDIKPSGAGQAHAIRQYLEVAQRYFQIVVNLPPRPELILAVVDDTEIIVGCQFPVGQGWLLVLPPPSLQDYQSAMFRIMDMCRYYYDRAQRRILPGDAPEWVTDHLTTRARKIQEDITTLRQAKEAYDQISYVMYGTGEELEVAIAALLSSLGLTVDRMPKGSNIDLRAKYAPADLGFAIEATGTKGVVQKDGTKIPQAMQYLAARAGTAEEKDRLIIVANTQYNLDPKERKSEAFTGPVVSLLSKNDVLLMTTLQLYDLWKAVQEGSVNADDLIRRLHKSTGRFKP